MRGAAWAVAGSRTSAGRDERRRRRGGLRLARDELVLRLDLHGDRVSDPRLRADRAAVGARADLAVERTEGDAGIAVGEGERGAAGELVQAVVGGGGRPGDRGLSVRVARRHGEGVDGAARGIAAAAAAAAATATAAAVLGHGGAG